jgi:quercetin dioxygenase-like cupin family protein
MATIRLLTALAMSVAASMALAQQALPMENKGMSASQLSALDLSKQGLNDLDRRQMRMRQITIEPGGAVAFHSHAERPALTYVLKGTLLEHRKGGPDRTYAPGEVITESTDVDHWAENKGSTPVTLISVDLFKE